MKTTEMFVKIYDITIHAFTAIPKAELQPGMILANIEGIGQAWLPVQHLHFRNN